MLTALSGSWRWLCCLAVACSLHLSFSLDPIIPAGQSLHSALDHFEVLHKHHLKHTNNILGGHKTISFSTLGRAFRLHLTSRRGLFTKDFEVHSIGGGGETRRHYLDVTHFFTGHLEGEVTSQVTAHLDHSKGILSASIRTDTEHYFIEPSSRHFNQSHDFHMISYRGSDIKQDVRRNSSLRCGTVSSPFSPSSPSYAPLPPAPAFPSPHTSARTEDGKRLRRQATPLSEDSCPMLLVGTARFHQAYSQTGGDDGIENTILFMVQVIDDIDQNVFRQSRWDTDIQNFGLSIKNITVYTDPTVGPPYNSERTDWVSGDVLRLFSHADWSQFCLAHLFTYQQFTDGLVGVAYPASADNFPGGICTEALTNFNGGTISTANVGLSSYQGSDGNRLLAAQGRLITAHEIGHNWGSEHDPTSPIGPCNPQLSNDAGKFLMFPSMSDGTQNNNDVFSGCSLDMVADVLRAKSQNCFSTSSETQCGNYEVERDEECDAGLQGTIGTDPCCNERCRFKNGANCSDSNHVCCTNCDYSPPSVECLVFPADNRQCATSVRCDGVSKDCPSEIPQAPVNSSCGGNGQCLYSSTVCNSNGECVAPDNPPDRVECYDFCELRNTEQCFCPGEDECHYCCQQASAAATNTTPPCVVVTPLVALPDGTSCTGGLCRGGECEPTTQDLVNRLFSLFTDISINAFFEFMAENIVGTVVILTGIIWIIGGIIVHCVDRYYFNRYREAITELENDQLGNLEEDQMDTTYLDNMTPLIPTLDSQRVKRGLSRMGSRHYHSLDRHALSRQYSIATGYRRPPSERRVVYGRSLSTILKHSKEVDPRTNIMEHVLNSGEKIGEVGEREGEEDVPGSPILGGVAAGSLGGREKARHYSSMV